MHVMALPAQLRLSRHFVSHQAAAWTSTCSPATTCMASQVKAGMPFMSGNALRAMPASIVVAMPSYPVHTCQLGPVIPVQARRATENEASIKAREGGIDRPSGR
jgi:hypothetical protein